jgi:SNF family Na+-dependent transporter
VAVEDKFYINLNQNLWGLVVCYAALGVAEHWGLRALFWLSLISSCGMTLSALFTLVFYTWRYCKDKVKG